MCHSQTTNEITEFPDIRSGASITLLTAIQSINVLIVDYFREIEGRAPPLACFVSHVHSDHLQGLESLRAPFVYCSHATREVCCNLSSSFAAAFPLRSIVIASNGEISSSNEPRKGYPRVKKTTLQAPEKVTGELVGRNDCSND